MGVKVSATTMQSRDLTVSADHERVIECVDEASGYHGIIAIHSTARGPAVGGTRVWAYPSIEDALHDVLRLSRGMSFKSALAGLKFGGGKAVVIADNRKIDREQIFRAHGRFVDTLKGRFITGEDVGTTPADMALVRLETPFVAGLAEGAGDPSPHTARGVFRAMQAAAAFQWRDPNLSGRRVAIQGCGHVGYHLALELHRAGALLVVADIDSANQKRVAEATGARAVAGDAIFDADADIFAPCALGGILNDATIPRLRASIICGAANNQLAEDRHGGALKERGIVYVPDYVANAGGIINGAREIFPGGMENAADQIEAIFDTTLEILELARNKRIPPSEAADALAQAKLRSPRE